MKFPERNVKYTIALGFCRSKIWAQSKHHSTTNKNTVTWEYKKQQRHHLLYNKQVI